MKTKSNPTVSLQIELVGVVSWTWVGLGFDNIQSQCTASIECYKPCTARRHVCWEGLTNTFVISDFCVHQIEKEEKSKADRSCRALYQSKKKKNLDENTQT